MKLLNAIPLSILFCTLMSYANPNPAGLHCSFGDGTYFLGNEKETIRLMDHTENPIQELEITQVQSQVIEGKVKWSIHSLSTDPFMGTQLKRYFELTTHLRSPNRAAASLDVYVAHPSKKGEYAPEFKSIPCKIKNPSLLASF